ncbi:hypothetical protein EHM76_07065 [bacterium]|nr:MAG: hypothetical protein EHM76_07065 [bacterium]
MTTTTLTTSSPSRSSALAGFSVLCEAGFAPLDNGHGVFHAVRCGRVTVDVGTRTVFLRGEGAVVSQKVASFTSDAACSEAALTLALMVGSVVR